MTTCRNPESKSEPPRPEKSRLFQKLCHLAAGTSKSFGMLGDGDRIIVGISGGEDSLTLMHVLSRLRQRSPFSFELFPVFVDMNFDGVERSGLIDYCQKQGWNLEIIRINGAQLLEDKSAHERPCSLCSRLRRGQLHAVADRLHCNKIALGQHLDDLCVSLLMSLFRGGGLKTMGPNVAADIMGNSDLPKRIIRPFAEIEKSFIHSVAALFDYPAMHSCPYEKQLDEHGDRAYLERMLTALNEQFPFIRSGMRHSMGDIRAGHLLDKRYLNLLGAEDPDSGKL